MHDTRYARLSTPWYTMHRAASDDLLRKRLEAQTPEPFARHNIFCTNKVWVSKREMAEALRARRRRQEKQPA
ncbi:MAG TPA: hypothetical protein VHZ51_27280 [Ktedonobacteraceae bacterium]|nr:hypothetical protein [Ktedonobacteraceae bacterium]